MDDSARRSTPHQGRPKPTPNRPVRAKSSTPTPGPPRTKPRSRTNAPRYQRGDVWFVVNDENRPPVGTEIWPNRPAVIVSNNVFSNKSGFVQVVYLTTSARKRSGPTHVEVGELLDEGRVTMAMCEQVHTVDVSRLAKRLSTVSAHHMVEIDAALTFSLSIGHGTDYGLFKKWEQYIQIHGIDIKAEIDALCAMTTNARVESLTRALNNLAAERDALRDLYHASASMPALLDEVRTAMSSDTSSKEPSKGSTT